MHLNTPEIKEIALVAFPEYSGRTFQVKSDSQCPKKLTSYWSGGSRNYFAIVKLDTLQTVPIPENGTPFNPEQFNCSNGIPLGFAVVENTIFCGKDLGITIYVNKQNLAKLLPPKTEITNDEKIVLVTTCSLKSSYAGDSNYRFTDANRKTGITLERWEIAKQSCISKKLLDKRGAITNEGRNIIEL